MLLNRTSTVRVQFEKGTRPEVTIYGYICRTKRCPRLNNIRKGDISLQPEGDFIAVGTTVIYKCWFKLIIFRGTQKRTCQGNGTWSGEEARCEVQREYFFFSLIHF